MTTTNSDNTTTSQPAVELQPVTGPQPNTGAQANAAPAPTSSSTDEIMERVDRNLGKIDEQLQLLDCVRYEDDFEYEPLDFELPAGFLLSIVIPVYNEQETIGTILQRVARIPVPREIIIVDDCSTDETRAQLGRFASCEDVTVILKSRNEGKGAALRSGFEHAQGDVVVVQDADLEYDPRDIPKLLKPIVEDTADVVYGSRFLSDVPQDPSAFHRFGNALLTKASNLFTRLRLTDMETCYKAIRRNLLRSIPLRQNRFGFEPEITAKLARRKARVSEVPIRYYARGYDEGKKIGIRDAVSAFYCIVRYGIGD